jgi:hypothetical protein
MQSHNGKKSVEKKLSNNPIIQLMNILFIMDLKATHMKNSHG